jgi:hypothetical protein
VSVMCHFCHDMRHVGTHPMMGILSLDASKSQRKAWILELFILIDLNVTYN